MSWTIGFDADDTLWHNENIFSQIHAKYASLLAHYEDAATVEKELFDTEMRNLSYYGYGIKGFTLSMIETAIEITGSRVTAAEIATILAFAREMQSAPVQLIENVETTVRSLARSFPLILITKGDLFDQESKLARSGLAGCFSHVEIVSEKHEETYRRILARHAIDPARFVMVGNSMRSDILPAVAAGATGVFIPYHLTWAHEHATTEAETPGVTHLGSIRELPSFVHSLTTHFPNS